ncbi:MAG: AtpZ/AtpI family protein [Sphaerospermopsis sp. SIO1G2]|nr:AtpZ/AtpI family protein [Sphaerospermopsis sp. SIO1G2]
MTTPEEIAQRVAVMEMKRSTVATPRPQSHYGMIVRLATEMLAAVGVGVVLGYYLDEWLNSSPVFLLLCLIFGTAAGFVTLRRVNDAFVKEMEKSDIADQEMLDK